MDSGHFLVHKPLASGTLSPLPFSSVTCLALDSTPHALSPGSSQMTIQGDSQLALNQLMGRWDVHNDGLKPLHARARALVQALPYSPTYRHVPRASNSAADALANKAMNTRCDWEALAQPQAGHEAGGPGGHSAAAGGVSGTAEGPVGGAARMRADKRPREYIDCDAEDSDGGPAGVRHWSCGVQDPCAPPPPGAY